MWHLIRESTALSITPLTGSGFSNAHTPCTVSLAVKCTVCCTIMYMYVDLHYRDKSRRVDDDYDDDDDAIKSECDVIIMAPHAHCTRYIARENPGEAPKSLSFGASTECMLLLQ